MMKKRKAIALLLSLVLLLCNSISVVAAEPAHVEAVDSASEMESSTVDLSEICSVQPYADGWNIATTENPILTEIDFSNAVSVDLSYGNVQDLANVYLND